MLKMMKRSLDENVVHLTQDQLYMLDVCGLVIVKNFVKKNDIDYINSVIDGHIVKCDPTPSKFGFMTLDPIFMELMTHEWIMRICKKTVGDYFRLDHVVGIEQPGMIKSSKTNQWVDQGYDHGNVHGGLHSSHGSCFYHASQDKTWSGHMTFGLSLTGQNQDTGGFCYIPGSHKQSAPDNGGDLFKTVLHQNYRHPCMTIPDLAAGDAVFFPESLMHGATPLKRPTKRRAIYYKYMPSFCVWRDYEEIKHYKDYAQTELQRNLLRAPYVANIKEEGIVMSDNFYKGMTFKDT